MQNKIIKLIYWGAPILGVLAILLSMAHFYGGIAGESYGRWRYRLEMLPDAQVKIVKEVTKYEVVAEIARQAERAKFPLEAALKIAQCESHFNPDATNDNGAAGIYQFKPLTWESLKTGTTPWDYKENIKQFLLVYPKHPSWWECKA